ncbi:MAG: hypothetical protein KAJ40_05710 [Alphaproteobacteria bacterium]|nr:hypothetical protein [Alphaproteobacteria bacterium]
MIYKKKYMASMNPRKEKYQEYNQTPQQANQTQLCVPKKAKFQVSGVVISMEMTLRSSYVIGVEVESKEKLDFNQEIALVGEEIIQEKLERIETKTYQPQKKEPEIIDKLNELIAAVEKKKSNADSVQKSVTKEEQNTNFEQNKKFKPKNSPWHKKRPQKDTECSKCHVIRKTRWQPKTPGEKYVCHVCAQNKEEPKSPKLLTDKSEKSPEAAGGADEEGSQEGPEENQAEKDAFLKQ